MHIVAMDTKCQGPQRLNMGIGKAFPRSGSGNCHNLSPIHIQMLTMCAKASNHALLPLEWLEPGAALLQTPLMDGSQTGLLIQLYTAKLPLQFGCINTLYEAPGLLWLWVPSIWVTTVHPILDFLYVSLLFLQCHLVRGPSHAAEMWQRVTCKIQTGTHAVRSFLNIGILVAPLYELKHFWM